MRPLRLEMEGFGAFRERTVVDFTDLELVALVGRTGSGKSTIIDAITFALFGSVARYDDKKVVAPVVNQTSQRARVQLEFELGDRRFTAVRLVQRTRTGATTREARLEHAGAVLAAEARGVTAEVERLLGLDADQFNRTVVLPQGRFADFLHDSAADRQRTLRSLLGLGIYQAVASEARRRAATARVTADALRPDLDAGRARLTDDVRAGLVTRHTSVVDGRAAFLDRLDDFAAADAEATGLDERVQQLDEHLALLAGVRAPAGLAALDRRRTSAAAALAAATSAADQARTRRRAADEAVAAGPDPIVATTQAAAHRAAREAHAEHDAAVAELTSAEKRAAAARTVTAEIVAAQEDLDARVVATSAAEDAARSAASEAGIAAELDHWLGLRRRHGELIAAVESTAARVADAAGIADTCRATVDIATAAEVAAAAWHADLRDRAGAAGFVALLHVGDPCPLCLQTVAGLPEHDHGDELARAVAAVDEAAAVATDARARLAVAGREHTELAAQLAADTRAVADLTADLDGVPAHDELRAARAAVDLLQHELDLAADASRFASEAATAHRARGENVEALRAADAADRDVVGRRALEASLRARREQAASAVVGMPAEADVELATKEAARLAADQHDAIAALAAAEDELTRAMAEQRSTEAATHEATAAARAARDDVAALSPPPLGGDGPAAVWDALTSWAATERARIDTQRAGRARQAAAARGHAADIERGARRLVDALLGSSAGDLDALRDRLAQAETAAESAITAFDADRARVDALAARVDEQDERRHVADQLALQLRADHFEAWLMEAAVGELVDAASVRLRELTAGQFSLALVDNTFMVRDHANADELRSARTLSGGETFLASLALALALADATSELAPEGAPALESIFLDEGFGSLDPATLDVVAAAIEELGSAGRMVVVVTHIRELADRLPVRLEVVKTALTSTVERVDA